MAVAGQALTPFERIRNLGVVVLLALGFALTLAIYAESALARPACAAYGASRGWRYVGLEYPSAPVGWPERRLAACLFIDAAASGEAGRQREVHAVTLADVASRRQAILVDVATTPLLTTPVLVVLFVFLLYQVYGALGVRS